MSKAVRVLLYGVICAVCLLMLLGYISTIACNVPAFWMDPVPIYEAIFGMWISNLDMVSMGIPICGICLMLLYIDIRQRAENEN